MSVKNPKVSVVVPAYNSAGTVKETLTSILRQTFRDFEVIVVNDGSTDSTLRIAQEFSNSRLRIVTQPNRGLAGARNSGIHASRGEYIAFCDADDVWEPEKLDLHVQHLDSDPSVGISFAGSSMIDARGKFLKVAQRPKLRGITAADVFKRNPIGNGSVAVVRKSALDCIAYRPFGETERDWWFDETMRQSEDIDAWMRFILASDWKIEGIEGLLTRYRIAAGGLSANLTRQFETWKRMRDKVRDTAPALAAKVGPAAEAYQLRFLARRAFMMRDGKASFSFMIQSLKTSPIPIFEEPVKTATTIVAAIALRLFAARRDLHQLALSR